MDELEEALCDNINFLSEHVRNLARVVFGTSDYDKIHALAKQYKADYDAQADKSEFTSLELRNKTNCALALFYVAETVAAIEAFDYVEALGRFGAASMCFGAAGGEYCHSQAKRPVEARGRTTNLKKAVLAAIEGIGHHPTISELWEYWGKDKDETGFILDQNDKQVCWMDTKGEDKWTTKSAVSTMLGGIKKKNQSNS